MLHQGIAGFPEIRDEIAPDLHAMVVDDESIHGHENH